MLTVLAFYVAAVILTLIATLWERRRHGRLSRGRSSIGEDEFLGRMTAAGVSWDIAKFVLSEASFYYFTPLKPDPADRWESTMRIDPEELGDITEKFWKQQCWDDPSPEDPIPLPNDPSLLEYARWLEDQRRLRS